MPKAPLICQRTDIMLDGDSIAVSPIRSEHSFFYFVGIPTCLTVFAHDVVDGLELSDSDRLTPRFLYARSIESITVDSVNSYWDGSMGCKPASQAGRADSANTNPSPVCPARPDAWGRNPWIPARPTPFAVTAGALNAQYLAIRIQKSGSFWRSRRGRSSLDHILMVRKTLLGRGTRWGRERGHS
jgi:hypothetical protein